MLRKTGIFFLLILFCMAGRAQELQARVTINSSRISSQTDKKIFQTLQSALNNFLNSRKWTKETFQPSERIVCNFLITINQGDNNFYQSSLVVQAARPVYNSSYETPLINFMDENVGFKYIEYQPVEFNENRVSGTDPSASNLTAILAFYANIILGLDFDSFSLKGGDAYFQKAQNIVNNAPDGRDILGWRAFDGQRNRYWLIENLTNSRYTLIHDALYSYYRLGMDKMYDNEVDARKSVLNTLNMLNNINTDAPNSMIMQFFFLGRNTEFINIFKKAPPDEKTRASEILAKLDVTNANRYKQELR
ncbi:MAG: DUF4835 family protein [Williamsia sp.]|nr:DUF4835 family protein [Williamsia sp.]